MADFITQGNTELLKLHKTAFLIAFASKNGHLEKLANEKGNKKAIEYLST